ncbi:ISL3 family transposase, partial [Streptacidiphilus rugosus]|uniref:ISL3 family transposase n=1 Tax=Streptacidiphilus rugosus TaxID=405783 RepID=UPI00055E1BA1
MNQPWGRVEADHATLSPRKAARLPLADPTHPREDQLVPGDQLARARPQMTAPDTAETGFAAQRTPKPANAAALTDWITQVRAADPPFPHAYATGFEHDRIGVDHALTPPWHNGRTEGVNNKIILLKRQTYGRAGHRHLRQRILLS